MILLWEIGKRKIGDYFIIFVDLIYGHFDIQCVEYCQEHHKSNQNSFCTILKISKILKFVVFLDLDKV